MDIKEIEPKSLSDYISKIKPLRKDSQILWFRGISNSKHSLVPSFFRQKSKRQNKEYAILEREMFNRFTERSLPYLTNNFSDNWSWLFFMQHYGIPTRLLDWTENPFIALFFALESIKVGKDKKPENDIVVWVLDPVVWNRSVLSYQTYTGGILNKNDKQLDPYTPPANFDSIPKYPLAINGIYNSKRIAAQKGTFMIFGSPKWSMEGYFEKKVSSPCLNRILIKKENVIEIKEDLISSGITESVVYPDLDGLSKEINRQFTFGEYR